MSLKFGTDGLRGVANSELSPEIALALGRAAARVLGGRRFVVGRDTRVSGPLLQAALAAGLASEGVDVVDLGVLPTPAVAFLSAAHGVPAAMISASHNPYPDNGIKLFQEGGRKLDDGVEAELETEIAALMRHDETARPVPTGGDVGRLLESRDSLGLYVSHLVASMEGRRLDGLRIVVDCAHGAASRTAPETLGALGAEVMVLNAEPDGTNINAGCGSTHPEHLQAVVVERNAHAGLAFDGDADRVLAVDHLGRLVDGDQIMAILARDMKARGKLVGDTLVLTVMSNLGLRVAMETAGVDLVETPVGDRYVLEAMERGGWCLGGEQSGHIIFRALATTGDGVLTGLRVLDVVARSGETLASLADDAMTRFPQVLRNVAVPPGTSLEAGSPVWDEVAAVEKALGSEGRVLLRASGTEPVIRVMVEAVSEEQASESAERLCSAVARTLTA